MSKDKNRNSWIRIAERNIFASPFMSVHERDYRSSEDERQQKFYVLQSRDWCNVVPVTEEGKIVLVKQFRVGVEEHTLEIPGGVVDESDKDIASAAVREMAEETGYEPLPEARIESLGWTWPNPAILNNRAHAFICGPVRKMKAQNLDAGEMIEVVELGLDEIRQAIASGSMKNAIVLNAFLFLVLERPDFLKSLKSALNGFSGLQNPVQK